MSGCSSLTKKVYVQPNLSTFRVVEVNVTELPLYHPPDVETITKKTKIKRDGTEIRLSVNSFVQIQNMVKKLRLQVKMYKKAFKNLKVQIERYEERLKDDK